MSQLVRNCHFIVIITSAKEVLFTRRLFVCLFSCLFDSLTLRNFLLKLLIGCS